MTWSSIGASVIGTSHVKVNMPCQDYEIHDTLYIAGHECFYCFASDGAGTASRSREGASLSCTLAERFIIDNFSFDAVIDQTLITKLIKYVKTGLNEYAEKNNVPLREYSCTFLGAITYQDTAIFFQIGDGAIIINQGKEHDMELVFWPDNGEYLNTTNFIGAVNSLNNLQYKVYTEAPIHEIALLTDGLQMICLDYENKCVHQPFFRPLFNVLKLADNPHKIEVLHGKLTDFLSGALVNARTDDDKTLILATLT